MVQDNTTIAIIVILYVTLGILFGISICTCGRRWILGSSGGSRTSCTFTSDSDPEIGSRRSVSPPGMGGGRGGQRGGPFNFGRGNGRGFIHLGDRGFNAPNEGDLGRADRGRGRGRGGRGALDARGRGRGALRDGAEVDGGFNAPVVPVGRGDGGFNAPVAPGGRGDGGFNAPAHQPPGGFDGGFNAG